MNPKILIAEISGKRPGDRMQRPTEKFNFDFDKVIISNNSEGYKTDWDIVNVPESYEKWYKDHCKMSDLAYYAPMNRSYAIKYAREHGYDYLVQLDDNIMTFNIKYIIRQDDGTVIDYSTLAKTPHKEELPNDMFRYMSLILENTNVGMVGMAPDAGSLPMDDWLNERYVYSAFMLDLSRVPAYFQGDFEDDIEYRLKLKQIQVPSLEIVPFHYSKTSQDRYNGKEDSTGNREAYIKAGLKRGEHMSKLYGDMYERGYSDRGSGVKRTGKVKFRHKVKRFKVGVRCKNIDSLKHEMTLMFQKYATHKEDAIKTAIIYPKKIFNLLITDESQREKVLSKIVELCIKYEMDIVEPNTEHDPLEVYSILFSGDQEKLAAVRNEMNLSFNFEGVQIIDS